MKRPRHRLDIILLATGAVLSVFASGSISFRLMREDDAGFQLSGFLLSLTAGVAIWAFFGCPAWLVTHIDIRCEKPGGKDMRKGS